MHRRVGAVPSGLQQQGDIYQFNALARYKYTCQPSLHSTLLYSPSHARTYTEQLVTAKGGNSWAQREGGGERVSKREFYVSSSCCHFQRGLNYTATAVRKGTQTARIGSPPLWYSATAGPHTCSLAVNVQRRNALVTFCSKVRSLTLAVARGIMKWNSEQYFRALIYVEL